jgi:hypothetical protein
MLNVYLFIHTDPKSTGIYLEIYVVLRKVHALRIICNTQLFYLHTHTINLCPHINIYRETYLGWGSGPLPNQQGSSKEITE